MLRSSCASCITPSAPACHRRPVGRRKLGLVASGPGEGHDVPLNQEDLLGTLTFTVTVFEVLEQFGITWTRDEQEAYLRAWDKVGASSASAMRT